MPCITGQWQFLSFTRPLYWPLDEDFVVHVNPSCTPACVQEVPVPLQQHSVPHVARLAVLVTKALPVTNAFSMARYLYTLDSCFPTAETKERVWRNWLERSRWFYVFFSNNLVLQNLTGTSVGWHWSNHSRHPCPSQRPSLVRTACPSGPGNHSRHTLSNDPTHKNIIRNNQRSIYLFTFYKGTVPSSLCIQQPWKDPTVNIETRKKKNKTTM